MASCASTCSALVMNSPTKRRMRPAWMIQIPAFFPESSSRFTCAAMRFAASTSPTSAPPGKTAIDQPVPGTCHHTKKLRMYRFTAPSVPRFTCASVQATTSTMSAARQTMLVLREVRAPRRRTPRSLIFKAEGLQQSDELGLGSADRVGVAGHLDEPGVAARGREARDGAAPRLALAPEVVHRHRPRLRLERLAGRRERRLVDGGKPDLRAPPVHVRQLAARRSRKDDHGDVDAAGDRRFQGGVAHAAGEALRPA